MSNRSFHSPEGSLELRVVTLWMKVAIGAAGAPTINVAASKGITSITRNSAGNYTVVLADRYKAFLGGNITLLDDTDSDPATVGVHSRFVSEAVDNATPSVVFQTFAGDDGAATDPANGATLYMELTLRNSSVG